MGLSNIDARFRAVTTTAGTTAHQVVEILRTAAREINDTAGPGESVALQAIVGHLEQAAHLAGQNMNQPAKEAKTKTSGRSDDK
jgi:hypothetical protein